MPCCPPASGARMTWASEAETSKTEVVHAAAMQCVNSRLFSPTREGAVLPSARLTMRHQAGAGSHILKRPRRLKAESSAVAPCGAEKRKACVCPSILLTCAVSDSKIHMVLCGPCGCQFKKGSKWLCCAPKLVEPGLGRCVV